jgi:hypothetical protein
MRAGFDYQIARPEMKNRSSVSGTGTGPSEWPIRSAVSEGLYTYSERSQVYAWAKLSQAFFAIEER